MVAAEHTILTGKMDRRKIYRNRKLKSFYLPIIVSLVTVILVLLVTDLSHRILGLKVEKKIEKSILVNNSKSTKYFDTLKDIQDFIWNKLDELQESGNCEDKAILYCEGADNFSGLGSMLFRYGYCLQVAFALGRTMFIYQRQYQHFGGLNKWLRLEPEKCRYLKENYRNYPNRCNLEDRKCYLDENVLVVNNSYKVLEIFPKPSFPIPRYIPSTIPSFIEEALLKLKVKDPWLWFTSQFLGYLVLRPNDEFQKTLENIKSNISFSKIGLSLHIRRGDKITRHEANFIPDEKFIDAIQNLFDHENIKEMNSTRIIYVASDDNLSNMKKILPSNYIMKRLPPKYLSEGLQSYFTKNFPSIVLESILIDINLLAHTDFTICTMSSNIGRLIYLLKNAIPPYNTTKRVISLDSQEFFGRYYWYGFNVPMNNYFITKNRRKNINLNISGIKHLLNYEKGYLYEFVGPQTRTDFGNCIQACYVYTMKPIYQLSSTYCSIFSEDLTEWPGKPEYPLFL